mgnify:CR=1 FL=1
MWSFRILGRYILLQLPVIIILILVYQLSQQYETIPGKYILILLGIWIIKDIVLYPFVWRAYDARLLKAKHTMIGLKGVCIDRLDPEGYIRVRGERWRAQVRDDLSTIKKGERVYIYGNDGLTLLVKTIYENDSVGKEKDNEQ